MAHGITLLFDADQITEGANHVQAQQAIDLVNAHLRYSGAPALGAQLCYHREELEVEVDEYED